MVELIYKAVSWIDRHIPKSHERKPRNVLVTYNGVNVRWRTQEEVDAMIRTGTVDFVTPQRGKTIKYTELVKENSEPTLDE